MSATTHLLGQTFIVHAANEQPRSGAAGIYLFASRLPSDDWSVHFVGQCGSFRKMLFRHAQWPEAVQLGATHVLTLAVSWPANRELIEGSLIKLLQPVLNDHPGPSAGSAGDAPGHDGGDVRRGVTAELGTTIREQG
jgi:hypothetical protein